MRPVNTASMTTFCILATANGIFRNKSSLRCRLSISDAVYVMVPYRSICFEIPNSALMAFSTNKLHFVGNPLVIILLSTARMGCMSSYTLAPISKGARTSNALCVDQNDSASLGSSCSSMASSLQAANNCFGG